MLKNFLKTSMFRTFLRQFSVYFSIFIFKKIKFNHKKHKEVEKYINKKIISTFKRNPRLITHQNFSSEILKIIKLQKLKTFLRNPIIQNIIFIHNRFFIFFELLELKKDKNWNIWKKLISENDIGKPVRFFLYSKSSGNRIRQVYILKKILDSSEKIKLFGINKIIEVGGGYGCMADIFKKINKKISYTIYDMFEANLLQYYFLKMNNHKPIIGNTAGNLNLINNLKQLNTLTENKTKYILIANWSISEFPIKYRKNFFKTISKSEYSIISFQENFENINNLKFFKKMLKNLDSKFNFKLQTFDHYNNSFVNNNKHYLLTLVRK